MVLTISLSAFRLGCTNKAWRWKTSPERRVSQFRNRMLRFRWGVASSPSLRDGVRALEAIGCDLRLRNLFLPRARASMDSHAPMRVFTHRRRRGIRIFCTIDRMVPSRACYTHRCIRCATLYGERAIAVESRTQCGSCLVVDGSGCTCRTRPLDAPKEMMMKVFRDELSVLRCGILMVIAVQAVVAGGYTAPGQFACRRRTQ